MAARWPLGILFVVALGATQAHAAIKVSPEVFVVILASIAGFAALMWGIVGLLYLYRRLSPSVPALIDQGAAHYANGEYDLAIKSFDRAIRKRPQNPNAFHWRGETYRAKGDRDHALADFRSALALDPNAATRTAIENAIRGLDQSA